MEPSNFEINAEAMKQLETILHPSESKVIDGNLFKTVLDQDYSKNGIFVSQNSNFADEFMYCIRALMAQVEVDSSSTSGSGNSEPDNGFKLVGLFCLIALHNRLFHSIDKRLLSRIWELCKKVHFKKMSKYS